LPFVALSGLLKRAFVYQPCPVVNARGPHEARILPPGSAVRAAAEQPSAKKRLTERRRGDIFRMA
jgi:hypothetical protein